MPEVDGIVGGVKYERGSRRLRVLQGSVRYRRAQGDQEQLYKRVKHLLMKGNNAHTMVPALALNLDP